MNTEQLTKREYWADRAPEVPEWFKAEHPKGRPEPLPKPKENIEKTLEAVGINRDNIEYYLSMWDHSSNEFKEKSVVPSPYRDRQENAIRALVERRKQEKDQDAKIAQWDKENTGEAARLFQWKWFYADMMMKQSDQFVIPSNSKVFYDELEKLITDGLTTDGEHHKQWYLEAIATHLRFTIKERYEPGICP